MKISKWVDFGQEVEVDIDVNDIRGALSEAFATVEGVDFDERPTAREICSALNRIGSFLNAVTDEHIEKLNESQRETIAEYLATAAMRFNPYRIPRKNGKTRLIAEMNGASPDETDQAS